MAVIGAAVVIPDSVLLNVVFTPPWVATKLALPLDVVSVGNINVIVTLQVPDAASGTPLTQVSAVLVKPMPLIAALKKVIGAGVILVKVSVWDCGTVAGVTNPTSAGELASGVR